VTPIPGANAAIAALVASGLPTRAFTFLGFLPKKTGQRQKLLGALLSEGRTIVVYESPYRTGDLLADVAALVPDARVVVARELTKVHEEFVRGTAKDVAARYASDRPKGEVTVVIAPADRDARGEDAGESDA
jgi:16S rRNA (cytidine1402-2'-O)-methyltransferase